jgi:hypothetical protein
MNRSVKEQVKSGLRLGIGSAAFLIALMLLDGALKRFIGSGPLHQVVWSDWVAWAEIGLACALLLPTAQVWFWLVGGYALFGLGKSALMLVSGKELYTYQPVPRLEAAEAAFVALATLLLLFRFVDSHPNIVDRVILTFYVFAVSWSLHTAASTLIDPWLAAGLIGLAVSWCIYRWKRAKLKVRPALNS